MLVNDFSCCVQKMIYRSMDFCRIGILIYIINYHFVLSIFLHSTPWCLALNLIVIQSRSHIVCIIVEQRVSRVWLSVGPKIELPETKATLQCLWYITPWCLILSLFVTSARVCINAEQKVPRVQLSAVPKISNSMTRDSSNNTTSRV